MNMPPKEKTILPPPGGWEKQTFYAVEVASDPSNPIWGAIFFTGFLNDDDGGPGSYASVWQGGGEESIVPFRRIHYMKVLRKLDVPHGHLFNAPDEPKNPTCECGAAAPTRSLLERMGCPESLIEPVIAVVKNHLAPSTFYKAKAGNSAIRRLALKVPLERLVRVAEADHMGRTTANVLRGDPYYAGQWLLEKAADVGVKEEGPKPYLLGRHLLVMGYKPGKELGVMLKEAFEAQLEGSFEGEVGAIAWAVEKFGEAR